MFSNLFSSFYADEVDPSLFRESFSSSELDNLCSFDQNMKEILFFEEELTCLVQVILLAKSYRMNKAFKISL